MGIAPSSGGNGLQKKSDWTMDMPKIEYKQDESEDEDDEELDGDGMKLSDEEKDGEEEKVLGV